MDVCTYLCEMYLLTNVIYLLSPSLSSFLLFLSLIARRRRMSNENCVICSFYPRYGSVNYEIKLSNNPSGSRIFSLCDGKLSEVKGEPVALVTDLDGTLLGDTVALEKFKILWERQHVWRGSLLVILETGF